ncbi:hypothetical protein PR202_ga19576 [Eleusine coracana subsp. coracana]|uniref:Uncharacterized protein n=1 Tax=Eleusine coracana subsp. coracana TaxID=191504 RepID=A0AAV5CWR7_ELECO|nr:hypothetical protein PR202_ga19576 [Eleusine coracana subsp. coracana]
MPRRRHPLPPDPRAALTLSRWARAPSSPSAVGPASCPRPSMPGPRAALALLCGPLGPTSRPRLCHRPGAPPLPPAGSAALAPRSAGSGALGRRRRREQAQAGKKDA